MSFMYTPLLKFWYRIIGKGPADMPMVRYWQNGQESIRAKVVRQKDGSTLMHMMGEDHPMMGFPRGHLLFGTLSKLKHEIKNQIFNASWHKLEAGEPTEKVVDEIRAVVPNITAISEAMRLDMVPPERLPPVCKELYRAWTTVCHDQQAEQLRDAILLILQEDDSYRMRLQWMVEYFGYFGTPVEKMKRALEMMEHAEVTGDMKERVRLFRRIFLTWVSDPRNIESFNKFFYEINWKKMALTEGDKYHFRAKYFKVDLNLFDY